MEENEIIDDGTLACLNIPADRAKKRFTCPEEQQSNLIGRTFWIMYFFDNVPSRYSNDRYLMKIKFEKDDPDSAARKVWTGSEDIKFILDKLREMNKLPRKVTLRRDGKNHFFLE